MLCYTEAQIWSGLTCSPNVATNYHGQLLSATDLVCPRETRDF